MVKFEPIISLEEMHVAHVCGGIFIIENIGEILVDELKTKLDTAYFYNVMTDGSTGSSISENEPMIVD